MSSFRLWIYKLLTWWLPESRAHAFKVALLRFAGAKIGHNVRIYSSARFLGNGGLVIGDDVHIGAQVLIYSTAPSEIKIGSHIDIAPGVMMLTGGHEIDPEGEHIGGRGRSQSISIGDGSWLGARTIVLQGVSLPEKTITAAGAVVAKTIDAPKSLLAGVPATIKKQY